MGYLKTSAWFLALALFCTQVGAATLSLETQKACPKQDAVIDQNITIDHYQTLIAKGTFTIIPTRAPFSSGVWVSGPCKALKALKIQTNENRLTIASHWPVLGQSKDQASLVTLEVPIENLPSLTVILEGHAELIMGDLRLKKLNIQTKDQAHAQVTASDWLNMIALNHSSIYFTGRPKHVDAQSYDQSTLVSLLPPKYY